MENELNVEAAVGDIASDLGLGSNDIDAEQTTETTDPVETTTQTTETTAADPAKTTAPAPTDPAALQPRAAPKAWAKEQHERWGKLDKDTQDYIELREKQALEGISQYSERAKRADVWETAVKDYMPLIQAQGAQPQEAVRYLFEAHKNLSSGTPEQKAAFLAQVAQSYGIDLAKAAAGKVEETPAQRETRERLERLEHERDQEKRHAAEETQRRVANDVTAFAEAKDEKGNPKHPYFDECADDIVALIHAGHTLDKAYEKAVFANPVTRAKELERLRKADEEALRAKAKEEAEKARNASRTNVNSRDTRRAPTASPARKWEDTLDETMAEIKARTH